MDKKQVKKIADVEAKKKLNITRKKCTTQNILPKVERPMSR